MAVPIDHDIVQPMIDRLIQREGGYSNNPADPGGETMYGITKAVARKAQYTGPMKDMPISVAKGIYRTQYFDPCGAPLLCSLGLTKTAETVFDISVNMGVGTALGFLHDAQEALTLQGNLTAHVKAHGAAKVDAILNKALNCFRGSRYLRMAMQSDNAKKFIWGWMNNRVAF